jgi:hypothetical protein
MTPEEFFAVLRDMPVPVPQKCRLYHDDQGKVLFYTMEDLPGNWIEVDAVTYAQAKHDVRVVNGNIVQMPRQQLIHKLRPSDRGICCDPRDICLIVHEDQPHIRWSIETCE